MEVGTVSNPASTALNHGYSVSTFDASQVTLEMATELELSNLQPATLLTYSLGPSSDLSFGAKTSALLTLVIGSEIACNSNLCELAVDVPYLNPYDNAVDRELVIDAEELRCEIQTGDTLVPIDCFLDEKVL